MRIFITIIFLICATSAALSERRVALVVGNGKYEHSSSLKNPVNDADDVAAALEKVGFTVIKATDVDLVGLQLAIRTFAREAKGSDVSLFYYSGHGMQWEGQNVLVPTDAKLKDAEIVPFEVLPLYEVMNALALAGKAKILILDACRDNDAERALKIALAEKRGQKSTNVNRGLVPLKATRGQVVVFATQPNRTASDEFGDTSRNSPFTHAFLETINEPGLEIGRTFRKVQERVDELTRGAQLPEISMSLLGDFHFVPFDGEESQERESGGLSANIQSYPIAVDYQFAERVNTKNAWAAFLDKHGSKSDNFFVQLAKEAQTKLALGVFSENNQPPPSSATCTHRDNILKFGDYILRNRSKAHVFSKRRFGAVAAYLKIRYEDLDYDSGMHVLRPLLDANVYNAHEVAVPFTIANRDIDEALALIDADQLEAFYKLGTFGTRALILRDGGRTFLRLVKQAMSAEKIDLNFGANYSFGLHAAYPVVDQSDGFKSKFAELAEAEGELVLGAAVLGTRSELSAYHSFMKKHAGSERLHQILNDRALTGYGLTMLHNTGPVFSDPDLPESDKILQRQLYSIMRAAYFGGEQDFLNIYINQSGNISGAQEVADEYLGRVEGGFLNPVRNPDDAWIFIYKKLVEVAGRTGVDEQLNSFNFPSTRYVNEMA